MDSPNIKSVFLGSRSENEALYKEVFTKIIEDTLNFRKNFHAQDELIISEQDKCEKDFISTKNLILDELHNTLSSLKESVPTWDVKYMAHFHGDLLIPAIAGYVSAVLYNPNNVTDEASSATLPMEMDFMKQVSLMIGYPAFDDITKENDSTKHKSWGHLASGGAIANIEGIWVARNLKYVPIALKLILIHIQSITKSLDPNEKYILNNVLLECITKSDQEYIIKLEALLSNFEIELPSRNTRTLGNLSYYNLFNLDSESLMGLRQAVVENIKNKSTSDNFDLKKMLAVFNELYIQGSIRTTGLAEIHRLTGLITPKIYISSTCHNTWDKMPEILGLGQNALTKIPVDGKYHIDIKKLREEIIENKKNEIATLAIIGVFGSTEEGAIDYIDKLLKLRNELGQNDHSCYIHVDAAYGGYFASLLTADENKNSVQVISDEALNNITHNVISRIISLLKENKGNSKKTIFYNAIIEQIAQTVNNQWIKNILALKEVDSIVIDPHKLGYIPYPSGSIIFKDSRSREQTSFDAPYLEWKQDKLAWSGIKTKKHVYAGKSTIECSRPGAASAACYLASKVVPLTYKGYGKIMAYSIINSQKFISVLKDFDKVDNSMNSGFSIQLQYEQPDLNVIGWVIGLPNFIEKPLNINLLNEEIFSGMAKFRDTSVFSYNYFVSKTYLSFANYSHVLEPILLKLGIKKSEFADKNKNASLREEKLAILRSVLMNPLLFYLKDKHFTNFWKQQINLAKQALPKLLLKLLEDKNDGNRLEIIWLENEKKVRNRKQNIQYESLLSNHINIEFSVGNKFEYKKDKNAIVIDDDENNCVSILSRNGLKKVLIIDMNLIDNDHFSNKEEKIRASRKLISSLKEDFELNQDSNSLFIIPCSKYFWENDDFSNNLKRLLNDQFGIEGIFCVSMLPEEENSNEAGQRFSFELIKRLYLAAERTLS